jgi:hypothetical protein
MLRVVGFDCMVGEGSSCMDAGDMFIVWLCIFNLALNFSVRYNFTNCLSLHGCYYG